MSCIIGGGNWSKQKQPTRGRCSWSRRQHNYRRTFRCCTEGRPNNECSPNYRRTLRCCIRGKPNNECSLNYRTFRCCTQGRPNNECSLNYRTYICCTGGRSNNECSFKQLMLPQLQNLQMLYPRKAKQWILERFVNMIRSAENLLCRDRIRHFSVNWWLIDYTQLYW